jgi:signal transduction histidine kinase
VDLSVELYRIAQEALNNVARHAGEDVTVTITVQGSPGGLDFSIGDTGSGMDTEKLRSAKGLGLRSMAERAALVGGSLAIESQLGEGTCIRVRVPLADGPEEASK